MMNTQTVQAEAAGVSMPPVLELHDIKKAFGGTKALNGVSLSIQPGEVHGLIGENGAGKSTLIKVLCGIVRPDEGAINLAGRPYAPATPREAKANGLQVVHPSLEDVYLTLIGEAASAAEDAAAAAAQPATTEGGRS